MNGWRKYPASLDHFETMRADLDEAFDSARLPSELKLKLELGFEEAVVNVINYAYDVEGPVWIKTDADENFFTIEIADHGRAFNPIEFNDARSEDHSSVAERELGGFGIFLIKKTFERLDYSREKFKGRLANRLKLALRIARDED